MYTYEVWIRSQEYHGKKPLTYTSLGALKPGSVVKVDLKNKLTIGVVRRAAKAPKGVAMKPITAVLGNGEHTLPPEHLQLISWMLQYYPAGSGSIAQLFLPATWPKIETASSPTPTTTPPVELPPLTKEQTAVRRQMKAKPGSFLLHGDTGSGKTRIYIESIKDALNNNQSSLVLVPEIGLTPHLERQLSQVFPKEIIKTVHSGLTPLERKRIWVDILTSKTPLIVIGPRSALFSPLKNIGLIIADECHDDGYKQENAPYYHGLRIASRLAHLHNANLIFGSATPAIADMYIALEKKVPVLRMKSSAKNQQANASRAIFVNRRDKSEFIRSPYFSNTLLDELKSQLVSNQQSLLFLNRRGSARIVACNNCNWRALCPNCDLPLTLHEDSFNLRCHTCGHYASTPTQCPECNNIDIVFYGPGTKALEKEIQRLFPDASVARFDGDNLTHERLDKHLSRIQDGSIEIIIGTQVLVKGFDIPKLGLVGIIDADTSLSFPDFRTEEQTYQLINQASGRVGRGHVEGAVVVQTLNPENPLLQNAIKKDWDTFYAEQLATRRQHTFPPFTFLLKLQCSRKKRDTAITNSKKLKEHLEQQFKDISILGPAPAFKEKQSGLYTWQLVIKSSRRSILLNIIDNLPSGWKYDIDPTHLL